jgi:hypothetical protein
MINIQLLVWGAQHVTSPAADERMDVDPASAWMAMARDHARQVAANHVRADGTTYHIVEYHPNTGESSVVCSTVKAVLWAYENDKGSNQLSAPSQPSSLHKLTNQSLKHATDQTNPPGAVNKKYTYQGHAANSTWARGQAWALAGFGMLHSATGEDEFLTVGRRLADKYMELLSRQTGVRAAAIAAAAAAAAPPAAGAAAGSATAKTFWARRSTVSSSSSSGGADSSSSEFDDFIPQWDFDAPWHVELDGPRDTSGAAVAALGLLHLADADSAASASGSNNGSSSSDGSSCSNRYLCAAVNTLRALASDKYLSRPGEPNFPALLKHATGGFPLQNHVDVGLISGDYYFLAALAKCRGVPACVAAAAA